MTERCEYCHELYDNRLPCNCLGVESARDAATWRKSFRQAQERADQAERERDAALSRVERLAEDVVTVRRERDEARAEVARVRRERDEARALYCGHQPCPVCERRRALDGPPVQN